MENLSNNEEMTYEEYEEMEVKEKTKKSIKKKILIAGGALLGLVLSVIAIGVISKKDTIAENVLNDEPENETTETETETTEE